MPQTEGTESTIQDPNQGLSDQPVANPPTDEPVSTPAPQEPETRQAKVLTVPTHRMKEIKEAERERGRKLALQSLDEDARALGFKDYAAMKEAAVRKNKRVKRERTRATVQGQDRQMRVTRPEPDTQDDADVVKHPRKMAKYERQLQAYTEKVRRQNRALAHEARRARELERELDRSRAETLLRETAVRAGVQDVDYALHLLRRKLSKQTESELQKFDEEKFFVEELKSKHPYLYGVRETPATTGAGPQDAAPANGSQPTQANGDSGRLDVRKMSREDYLAELKKRGLQDPSTASSMMG